MDQPEQQLRFKPRYSIDCLTDGSEHTGDGTLFLSIWKSRDNEDFVRTDVPVARYAIAGVGDLTSRLAADQRYKLHNVKAVFCTTRSSISGLPTLQIILHQAGAAELSIVSCFTDEVEACIDLLEGRRSNPQCRLCQVPETTNDGEYTWWEVFVDSYIQVFATRIEKSENSRVAFSYSLRNPSGSSNIDQPTILLIPPDWSGNTDILTRHLPLHCKLRLVLALRPSGGVHSTSPIYLTKPTDKIRAPHLLRRAQQQSQLLNSIDQYLFPWPQEIFSPEEDSQTLSTGVSLVLEDFLRNAFLHRSPEEKDDSLDSVDLRQTIMHGISSATQRPTILDDNVISLSDEEESASSLASPSSLSLHVLGTGCASPSPYRNAAGYLLRVDRDSSIVFEAGEGTTTQLFRYCDDFDLSSVKLIWISHAHWDHYGGLVSLVEAIVRSRTASCQLEKIRRKENILPLIMAPAKVLKHLSICFPREGRCFSSVALGVPFSGTQKDLLASLNILKWANIRVRHSCKDAFGFVCQIRDTSNDSILRLAFSGDTAPCRGFQEACLFSKVDFLIHEASFYDEDHAAAAEKMHSTFGQALHAARSAGAKRLLLTHFSQKYTFAPDLKVHDPTVATIIAYDGMRISL